MSAASTVVGVFAAGLLLAGCADNVQQTDAMLTNAGFLVRGGNTPAYASALQELPVHHITQRTVDGILTYYYLDPTVCGCLYFGSEQNWQAYKQQVAEQLHIEAEETLQKDDRPYTGHNGI